MFMPFDPFRELDQLTDQLRVTNRIPVMPIDAYRTGDIFHVDLDLPGVKPESIEILVDKSTLTVKAERHLPTEVVDVVVRERPQGSFTREMLLSESLDVKKIEALYENGVLWLTIPVTEEAKTRHIQVKSTPKKETVQTASIA
jgi:HSP20 family protein